MDWLVQQLSNPKDVRSSAADFEPVSPLADMEEDDVLEIDSPEQEVVDQIEDDGLDGDELVLPAPSTLFPRVKDKPREKQLEYPQALPYETESIAEMDAKLDLIVRRLVDCVNAKDYDIGLLQWNHRLECWNSMKYPMKREVRIKLARLYFELCVLPGMDARIVEQCANMCINLIESKKKIDIVDLQFPWRSLYAILEKELFPKQRKTGITNVATTLLGLTEYCQRFFPPHEIPAMLKAFLPRVSANLNSILAAQAFCTHFLPLTHPQFYLPAIFKLWEAFNSNHYDDAWIDVMNRVAIRHLNPELSNPGIIEELRQASKRRGEYVEEDIPLEDFDDSTATESQPVGAQNSKWKGIRKDVSIFTDSQWSFMMTKCLRILAVPIPGSNAAAIDFSVSDVAASQTVLTMKKPTERLASVASLIVHAMSVDGEATGKTPMTSAAPSRSGSSVNLPSLADQKTKTYLAGSKALDSLAKLVQATESFYHPSNYGSWAPLLGRFLQNICYEFLKRWSEEQKKECPTPKEWRLTPEIRREFVMTMRTVALLSMYSRDPITIACAHAALRTLAHLEPDLIVGAVLERAFPALETLTETHRTTSSLSALAQLGSLLANRELYAAGAKNILPLLELCLPGLDVNDPIKTMSTSMFIAAVAGNIVFDDLTRFELDEMQIDSESAPRLTVNGEEADAGVSVEEEHRLVRESTAGFPDWISSFFRQVIALFEALPEPGKNNRNGGKMEESMTMTLVLACDFVCAQMSEPLFDMALNIVFEHVTTNVRTNSLKASSQLVSCFARTNSAKVLKKFYDLCDSNIRQELEQGAASARTTTAGGSMETDLTLIWWISLLVGGLTNAGSNFLPYKDRFISLMQYMSENCKSEISYSAVARMVTMVLLSLTNVFTKDHRSMNPDEWNDKTRQTQHHMHWGKTYEAKEVKIDWHVPTNEEVECALEIVRSLAEPLLDKLNHLVENPDAGASKIWTNDFCRYCAVLKACINGIPGLAEIPNPPLDPGAPASDMGCGRLHEQCHNPELTAIRRDEVKEFVFELPRIKSNILLTDANDPRHQFVMKLREDTGEMLHRAVQSLKVTGAEDSIDCVRMIIHTIKTLALDYPLDSSHHAAVKKSYEFALQMSRVMRNQKKFNRYVWIRRAVLYHASRMRLNSFYKSRTKLVDKHLHDLCELALSPYVQIRRSAQRGLDAMTQFYDGTRGLLYERLFKALAPGTDHNIMKGALFTLGSKMFQNVAILDWRIGPQYILTLLACSHQERPSVQNLVKSVTHDFVIRWAEPSTAKAFVQSDSLQRAADALATVTNVSVDEELLGRVRQKAQARVIQKNEAYDTLVPQLLTIAQDSATHWRYSLTATRFIRAMIRRDQPLRPDVSAYLSRQLISEHPNQRSYSMHALTKTLHFVKLRTMCGGSGEALLLNQTSNPLKRKVRLEHPLPADFTERFIESFSKPMDDDTLLMDKQDIGWLVWGDYVEFCAAPSANDNLSWDATSQEAIAAVRSAIMNQAWWDTFMQNLAQEKSNDYIAADATTLIKSVAQIFIDEPLEFIKATIDEYVDDRDNRHKQRAAGELIAGLVRGSKHWARTKQQALWDWLAPKLPQILLGMTPETQPAWEMTVEYILNMRDPRRNKPLVDFITSMMIDPESSEAFNTAKQQNLVGTAMKSLGWHFAPWTMRYINMYTQHLDHPFGEVRDAVSENLRYLSEARLHPSYGSVEVFLRETRKASVKDTLMQVDAQYEQRIEEMASKLDEWRKVRQPTAQGTQAYDRAAMTILTWILTSISDFRISTAFPFITRMLPEFFRCSEILDNDELRNLASKLILSISCLQFPEALARQLMSQFLKLLRESTSWRVRLDALYPLQVFYFHNLYLLDDVLAAEVMEALCDLLRDPKIEVRQAAADALSSMVRCSQRHAIVGLSKRFMLVVRSTKIPKRRDEHGVEVAGYQDALVKAHSGVLGIASLINAFPFEVPPFIPSVMIETMTKHSTSPPPISTTVKQCLTDFKRSHADSWAEDQKAFTEDQLMSLTDLLSGSSYYA